MESTAQYWKPVRGPRLERYWQPSCKKREGVSPMSGTQVSNSVRPMHLFGHNRDHDYYFELPCEIGAGSPIEAILSGTCRQRLNIGDQLPSLFF